MFSWIIRSSLRFRFLIVMGAIVLMLYGMTRLHNMPVDVFPEFAPPLVEIQTEALGMTTTEVEEIVTIPMEESLRSTPELDILRSKSVGGLSSIQLIFKPGTDILHARQLVQERLSLTKNVLPNFANPVMLQPLSATSRVMKIGITSKKYSLMDLSMTAYWKIRFHLLRVPGVANVPIWGERLKTLQVQVDPERMRSSDVTLNSVLEATSEALDFGLLPYSSAAKTRIDGFIETPNQRLGIQHILPVFDTQDLAAMSLKTKNGKSLTIGDVADVKWDFPLLIGDAVIDSGPGLMLIVEKFPWANTLSVTKGVEEALAKLRPGLPDVNIDSELFRPATFIELSIENLNRSLLIGCFLVMLVLFAFLFEWRVTLISGIAIPLSLMAAVMVLYVREMTINTMVLAGLVIALGAVVDDAIIDVENIVRRLRQHRKEGSNKSTAKIILEASLEVRSSIFYATVIMVLAVVPIFFLGGLSGAFFKPLAETYALAMGASLLVAMTVTPALALILLRNAPIERRESPLVKILHRGYHTVLSSIINAPRRAYLTVAAVVIAGLLVVPQLGQELLPAFKERDFLMHWLTKPGTSLPEMYRITVQASKELLTIPGVRNFGAHIGRALVADEVVGINFTENWISVDPKVPYDKTLQAIQSAVDGYPGLYRDVQTYLKERIREVLTGTSEAVVVRLYGPDLPTLRQKAKDVKLALENIKGLAHLHEEMQVVEPQIQITVNLEAAKRYGLKPGDVRRASAVILSGQEVSDIHRGSKVYDVMVWSVPSARANLNDIQNLLIDTPNGQHIRLTDVAEVRIVEMPNVIKRQNASRRMDVGANVQGRDLGSVVHDVKQALKSVQFPVGYYFELIGEYSEREAMQNRLLTIALLVIAGIFLLLQTSYRSWRLASITFLTLPTALIGGVIAIYFASGIISLGSLVGFLTVLGIAARNGIMLIKHYQHLEKFEGETFGTKLVLRGARERLSPILMTALATGLALVPLVVAGDIPGHEIELPTAVVILGGLVTSTLLNLFILPLLYLQYGAREGVRGIESDL